jgi:hypothetical protein
MLRFLASLPSTGVNFPGSANETNFAFQAWLENGYALTDVRAPELCATFVRRVVVIAEPRCWGHLGDKKPPPAD